MTNTCKLKQAYYYYLGEFRVLCLTLLKRMSSTLPQGVCSTTEKEWACGRCQVGEGEQPEGDSLNTVADAGRHMGVMACMSLRIVLAMFTLKNKHYHCYFTVQSTPHIGHSCSFIL